MILRLSLLLLFFSSKASALHETITYEYGLRAVIPLVFPSKHRANQVDSGERVYLGQRALYRSDYTPFPFIAQGMFGNVLINKDKLSWGLGYEFNFDYHSFDYGNETYGTQSISVKIQNHSLYLLGRLNLRDEFKRSVFVGLKTGIHLTGLGVSERITGTSFSISRENRDSFDVVKMDTWTPGLMAALQVGFKFYFFPRLFKRNKPGLKIIAELKVSTPTHTAYQQTLNASQKKVTGLNKDVEYRTHYTTFGIQFIAFTDFYRKRLLVSDENKDAQDDYNLN